MQPWEVRFAHPCRARARHPIHKAMGGHASHGRTSDRAFVRLGWSIFQKSSRRRKKKRPGNTPQSLKNVRATETARDVSILPREMSRSDRGVRGREALSVSPNNSRRRKKKRPRSTPQSLKDVRAKGLEPIRTKAPDPKSGLATNYNTLANPFRKTHNMKPIAEYDLVGSCRILCPKRNAKIVKDFQFSKPVRIFVKKND